MKKLTMLCAALCLAFTALAGDKMKLDLKITNDPKESMFYFNGSGTGTLDYEGRQLTAEIDLDFEHPVDGRYGALTLCDQQHQAVARYAITGVSHLSDAVSKRVTVKGIDGTSGSVEANLDFHRDRDRNYSLLFAPGTIPYFKPMSRLTFDSQLRIAPRVKSAEELEQEAQVRKITEERQARGQAEASRRTSRREARDTVGALAGLATLLFAVWMAPRAMRRRRLPHLLLFTALGLLSTVPPFVLLPVLPAYFWWYYNLYNENYGALHLDQTFLRIFYWSCGILGFVFYGVFGTVAIVYAVVWFIAGYVVHLLIFFPHMERARCPHCNYYGPNEIMSRELIDEHIHRTVTRRLEHSHTEERSDRIIEWYKEKYNVRIEADQRFRDFRRCGHCGEIFITTFLRIKTLSDKDY